MYIYGKNVIYEKLLNNSKINKLYLSKKSNIPVSSLLEN